MTTESRPSVNAPFTRFWLLLPVLATLACGGSLKAEEPAAPPAPMPEQRNDENSREAHEQLLAKAKSGTIDLYFLGDSITRRWGCTDPQWAALLENWKKNFHGWNAANFGWGGDRVEHMLWRVENGELEGVNPKVIVLLAGTNNIGRQPPSAEKADDIVTGIRHLIAACRRKAPEAHIILTGILPRNDGGLAVMPGIRGINARLAPLAEDPAIDYIDLDEQLALPDGTLREGMTVDRLHLTARAYQAWADALEPLLEKHLGPRADEDRAPPPTADPKLSLPDR